MSGTNRIKRKRGRPKGTTRLPSSYWLAILQAVDEVCRKRGLGVEAACRAICDKGGGLKWIACDYQSVPLRIKTLAQIGNAKVLSNRYYKALRFVRTHNIPSDRPRIPRQQFLVFRYTGGREGRLRKKRERHDRFVFMPNAFDLVSRK